MAKARTEPVRELKVLAVKAIMRHNLPQGILAENVGMGANMKYAESILDERNWYTDDDDPLSGTEGLKEEHATRPDIDYEGTLGYLLWYLSDFSPALFDMKRGIWRLLRSKYDWSCFLELYPGFSTDYGLQREFLNSAIIANKSFAYKAILPVYFTDRYPIEMLMYSVGFLFASLSLSCMEFAHTVMRLKFFADPALRRRVVMLLKNRIDPKDTSRTRLLVHKKLGMRSAGMQDDVIQERLYKVGWTDC